MLTALGLFIRTKMFSGTGLIVTIFGLIFAVFLFSNSNVILSKFGFETTTVLKSELTKTQGTLQVAVATNGTLNKTIDKTIENGAKKEAALSESFTERAKAKDTVAAIKEHRAAAVKDVNRVLDTQTTVTDETTTVPTAEYNKASEANINSVNEAFDKLFSEEEHHA